MHPPDDDDGVASAVLRERLETLASWIGELDARVRAAELSSGDQKTAKELRKAVEAIAKHDPKFQAKITDHVDVLSDRVATLAGTVSAATAAMAGKDGEIAALRRELADASARIGTLTAEVRTGSRAGELDELRRTITLFASERESQPGDKRLAKVEDKVALLAERVDTVSSTVSTATSGIAGREGDVAALRRRLDEDVARLGAAVAELGQTIDPAPVLELRSGVEALSRRASTVEQETRRGLVALGVDVESVSERLAKIEASVFELAEQGAEIGAVRELLDHGHEKTAVVESDVGRARDEIAELSSRMDSLAASVEVAQERDPGDPGVATLVERFEAGCAKVDTLVRDLQQALDTKPPSGADPAATVRIDALESQVAALADEIAGAAAGDEWRQLHALVDGLRMRLASSERELAALSGSRDVVPRLDDLTARLDAFEGGPDLPEGTEALLPVTGEGRFRVELRALELRIEHAEALARENRDAVLTQIERLATRIESRFRRLESEPEPERETYSQPATDGQVIPIRSGEA